MLTGQTPFRGENPMQTLTKHVFDAVTPPSKVRPELTIPSSLEAVIMRTLAKKRDERYASLDALMNAIVEVQPSLDGIVVPATAQKRDSGSSVDRAPRPDGSRSGDSIISGELEVPRRRPTVLVAVVAGVVGAGAIAVFTLYGPTHRQDTQPTPTKVATPAPPAPAPAVVPAPSVPATISIQIVTNPPGVDVYDHDERLCTTPPCAVTRPRGTDELELTFRKAGYKEERRTVQADRDGYIDVTLARDPIPAAKTPKPIAKTNAKTTPSASPQTPATPKTAPQHRSTELRNPFDDPPSK
jgi:serine/threonine-protein kinase